MDLIFLVNVYNDQHLAKRLIQQIKNHHICDIIVIGDGVKLEDYCKQNTIWFECNRAKAERQKGLWTQRYLELFLKHTNAKHLLRVDPDTCVWRSCILPEGEYDLFGHIEPLRYKYPYIRGGCIGFTRSAAEKIISSQYLLDKNYEHFNYQRYKHHRWDHEEESDEKIAFQDWIIGDVVHRLNLKQKNWEDICILGNQKIIPKKKSYSITHPHPLLMDYP